VAASGFEELLTVYDHHVSRAAKREAVTKVRDWQQQVSE
jgi:hypothetical protein